jgi:hypothetical protein
MNTYEKLVYLATEPFQKKMVLDDQDGKKLTSSFDVRKELISEFISSKLTIDLRQACETRVVDC